MSRLILWSSISLDGFFDGEKSWDLEWLHPFFSQELQGFSLEQLRSAARLLFGRVTYEGMAAYWMTAQGEDAEHMNKLPKTVFSSKLDQAGWSNTTLVRGDAVDAVRELKHRESGRRGLYRMDARFSVTSL